MPVPATSDPLDSSATNASTLSTWVAPYVAPMLGRAQALSEQAYTPYGGARVAEFSPLQSQAFSQYGNMQLPQQFGMATDYAQQLQGQLQGQNRSFTDAGIAGLYMSPYQQQVIDINKREAARQGQIANQSSAAQAVGKGAFGGSRYGIVQAENERNLQQRMADIQDRGMQDAFTSGRAQFNAEQQQGTQNVNTGYGIANLLGNLGTNQGNLNMQQLQALLRAGEAQQLNQQKGLDVDYNDFLAQQKYPYEQLKFQRDMLQSLPIATEVRDTQYAPPSSASQALGYGTAFAGIAGELARIFGTGE